MTALETIKNEIENLYKTNPNIHISISMKRPKITLSNQPAVIKAVYPNIFQIEEMSSGFPKCRTIQYADVLIKRIEIAELNK